MPTLHILCGAPGSGKTTLSRTLADTNQAKLHCFDDVPGAHSPTRCNQAREVFHVGIKRDLQDNYDVVIDDLHTKLEWREQILQAVSDFDCKKILYVMTTPVEECLRRNANRQARLPDFVVTNIHSEYQNPTLSEGWDEIIYI